MKSWILNKWVVTAPVKLAALLAVFILISETVAGQAIVVSSYFNANDPRDEWTELLVIQDNLDIRNWTFGDDNASQSNWQPRIAFNPTAFWRNLRAGTIIMIWHRPVNSSGVAQPEDIDPSDGYLQLRANNATYFSGGDFGSAPLWNGTSLNVASGGDIIQVRNASNVHIHALAHIADPPVGSGPGPDWTALTGPKLNHAEALGSNEAVFVCPGATLADYGTNLPQSGTTYTGRAAAPNLSFGLPNSCTASATANSDFWRLTRQPLWNSPVLTGTVNGTNTQVTLNWTTTITDPYPADNRTGYLILRNTADNFTDPLDGTNYAAGDNIGTSVVVANLSGSANITFSDPVSVPCTGGFYYRIYPYRFGQDNLGGNNFNTARGRAYNESQYASVHISIAPEAPSGVTASATEFCSGTPPADITLTANGGSGESLEWFTGSCGGTSIGTTNPLVIAPPVSTTTYYIRYSTALCGPSACADVTVTVNPTITPAIVVNPSANPVCAGTPVTFTANITNGGSAPVYAWYVGATLQTETSNIFTYTPSNGDQVYVMVTPVETCGVAVNSTAISMVVNPVPVISATGNNPAFCGQNGSITFFFTNVPDGTYTINYQTGSFPNVNVIGNAATISAAPGQYNNLNITVNGCTSTDDVDILIVAPTGSVINNVVPTSATCGNTNGSIIVTAAGGASPLEYSADNGANWQSSSVFSNLASGSYNVVVRDAALCETFWVNNPVVIGNTGGSTITQVVPSNATCGNSNGSISITATGGTAPLEYSIDNGISWQSSPVFSGLPAGSYTIIVRDGTPCETLWINNPVAIISTGGADIIQVVPSDASCGSSNGTINITASGGTAPLEYSINNGTTWQSSSVFNGLPAGNYIVIVRDGTFCETPWPGNPVLVNNIGGASIAQVVQTGTTCGNSNGSISITASGTAPLEYSIDNGVSWQSSQIFSGLPAGSYSVVVRDGTLCETLWGSNPVVLTNTSGASISSVNTSDASCGTSNGTIVINSTGGTAPLEYSINNGTNWQSSSVFSGLPAGSYSVIVRDGALCETQYASNPVIVGNTGGAAINQVVAADASCGNSNGSITITANGIAPLEYSINNGTTWQLTATFNGLNAGSYDVIVRDGALCLTPYAGNPVLVNSTGGATISQVVTSDAPCGNNSGSISMTATGIAPLEYSNNNGLTWQTSPVFNNLLPGSYTLIIRDGNLCETLWINNPVIINSIGGAAITQVLPSNTSCGNNNGSIIISAEDGVTPYEYSIDNGLTWQSSPVFNNLATGNYNVIVRDGSLCETNFSGNPLIISNVNGATILGVIFPETICTGGEGTINISATNGTFPLEYSIDNGTTWQTSPDFVINQGGSYEVLVRDGSLCLTNWPSPLNITAITGPVASVSLSSNAASVCQGEPVIFTAIPENEGLTPVYRWLVNGVADPAATGIEYSYVPANGDLVNVQMTSSEPCATNNPAISAETVFLSPCGFVMQVPNAFTPDNDLLNDIFRPVLGEILPSKYLLQVFNRWGEIVFETIDPNIGWDGTILGNPASSGSYTYKVEFEVPEYITRSIQSPIRGFLILIR